MRSNAARLKSLLSSDTYRTGLLSACKQCLLVVKYVLLLDVTTTIAIIKDCRSSDFQKKKTGM